MSLWVLDGRLSRRPATMWYEGDQARPWHVPRPCVWKCCQHLPAALCTLPQASFPHYTPPPPPQTHQSASLTPPPLSPLRHLPRPLPRPAFGSSPNLQALVLEAEERMEAQASSNVHASLSAAAVFYEVTIASIDQPKLLSRLSECLGDIGLNICEAHAFNTRDHYSLDVFVVNGWFGGGSEEFEETLSQRLQELPPPLVAGARGGAAGARDAPAPRGAQEHSKPLSPLSEQRVNPEDLLGLQRVRVRRWRGGRVFGEILVWHSGGGAHVAGGLRRAACALYTP